MNVNDLTAAVRTTLGDKPETFDIDGIVEEIGSTYGAYIKSLDDISNGDYFRIVQRHVIV